MPPAVTTSTVLVVAPFIDVPFSAITTASTPTARPTAMPSTSVFPAMPSPFVVVRSAAAVVVIVNALLRFRRLRFLASTNLSKTCLSLYSELLSEPLILRVARTRTAARTRSRKTRLHLCSETRSLTGSVKSNS
jgi:hypothetical protein